MRVRIFRKIVLISVILFGLAVFGLRVSSAIHYSKAFIDTLTPIFFNPHASYDEKMSVRYPLYFDFIKFIKTKTPEESTIYIPDVSIPYGDKMWPITSIEITSALLYPRRIVRFQEGVPSKNDTMAYVVIIKGEPSGSINSDTSDLIKSDVVITFQGDYNSKRVSSEDYGLIKL